MLTSQDPGQSFKKYRCICYSLFASFFSSFKLLPKETFHGLIKKYGLMIKLDYYGDIIKSYHDPAGSVITHISEVYEDRNDPSVLYFGSFKNDFIGKLRLNSKQTEM